MNRITGFSEIALWIASRIGLVASSVMPCLPGWSEWKVRGGGRSGFQYALAFDEERDGDSVFQDRGIRLLVDRPSLPYVEGSVIDFVDGLQGAGFKVDNPNVIAACGCGSSFRVADEEEVSAV